jgi:tetratricopeptide (TPR) repeat protein
MKARKFLLLVFCCGFFSAESFAQTQTPATTRSHVERFSSPQVKAEKQESDATQLIKSNPQDAENYNKRALARMRLARYQDAYEDLKQAASLKPDNADYLANLGYVLWKIGKPNDAIQMLKTAHKLNEKNFTANYQLGRFLLRLGSQPQVQESIAYLKKALEIDPRESEVRFDLLAAYRLIGDKANAVAQLRLLQDSRPSDARVNYIDGLLQSDRGDLNAAIDSFREALRRDSTIVGAWQDLGLAYIKQERWSDAEQSFAELIKRQSDSVEASYFYALSLFNNSKRVEAEKEIRRTLRLDGGASAAHTLLGIILAAKGGADVEASESLTQAVALDPTSFDAQFYLGRVQFALREYPEAARSFREAIKINPKNAEARFFLGTALESSGESEKALVEYQELVKIDSQSAFGQLGLGALLVKQNKLDEAIVALNKAVTLSPNNFEAHYALGRAFSLANKFNEAIDALQKATTLEPDRADAHYQLGLALQRAGRKEEAAKEFAIVEKINTEFRKRKPM